MLVKSSLWAGLAVKCSLAFVAYLFAKRWVGVAAGIDRKSVV